MTISTVILTTVAAAVASIIWLFGLTKIMGNKQISQLNLFDYINGITVGSIAAEMALADDWNDLLTAVVAMAVYGFTGFLISTATMNSMKARKFFSGEPLTLIENGKIYRNNIKKAKLDISDVMTAARCDGLYSIKDISLAVMETNGQISFRESEGARAVALSDLGQNPQEKAAPVNVLSDGMWMKKNIEKAGLTIKEISDEMRVQGFCKPEEIFLGVYENGEYSFYPKDESGGKFENYEIN